MRFLALLLTFLTVPALAELVAQADIAFEQCLTEGQPPRDCRFVRVRLGAVEEKAFRDLVIAAQRRQADGVWGFVSYSYRVQFSTRDRKEYAWLHVARDAAWLEGGDAVGRVVFTRSESARLQRILARLEPSQPSTTAQIIVKRLPVDVAWEPGPEIDLNCDLIFDQTFVGNDDTHYYVAIVLAPFCDSSSAPYLKFRLHGDSQDALCGDAAILHKDDLDFDIIEILGEEPEGWRRSRSCQGLRLESGDCDSLHLYWNAVAQKMDWWRL